MDIFAFVTTLTFIVLILIYKSMQINAAKNQMINTDKYQKTIEQAFNPSVESEKEWQNVSATKRLMRKLVKRSIHPQQKLTKGRAMNVAAPFSPPDSRQIDILKHFNIPISNTMDQTMAHNLIRKLFKDPKRVKEWNNRPPTTSVRQGLLFMQGRLISGLSHVQAQSLLDKLGMENPERYQEWKQIDRLFLAANSPEIRAKYKVRKITWKRFYESYEALKEAGISPEAMLGESIIEHCQR